MSINKVNRILPASDCVLLEAPKKAGPSEGKFTQKKVFDFFAKIRGVENHPVNLFKPEFGHQLQPKEDSYDYLFDDNHPASFGNTELPYVYNPHIKNYCHYEGLSPAAVAGAVAAGVAAVAAVTEATSSARSAAASERSAAAAESSATCTESSATTAESSVRWI